MRDERWRKGRCSEARDLWPPCWPSWGRWLRPHSERREGWAAKSETMEQAPYQARNILYLIEFPRVAPLKLLERTQTMLIGLETLPAFPRAPQIPDLECGVCALDKTTPSLPAASVPCLRLEAYGQHSPVPGPHTARRPLIPTTTGVGQLYQSWSPWQTAVGVWPKGCHFWSLPWGCHRTICLVVKATTLTLVSFYSPNYRPGVGPSTSLPASFLCPGRGREAGWPTVACGVHSLPPLSGLGPPRVDLEASAA